jgi:hypothetical protein
LLLGPVPVACLLATSPWIIEGVYVHTIDVGRAIKSHAGNPRPLRISRKLPAHDGGVRCEQTKCDEISGKRRGMLNAEFFDQSAIVVF